MPEQPGYRQMRFTRPAGSTELLLVRHGESEPMVPGRPFPLVDGHGDPELAPDGRVQAEQVAARLADHPIDAIYVTTLRRTAQTAAPLAARLGIEPEVEPDLREVHLGEWEGELYRKHVTEGHPIALQMFTEQRWDVIPGAESAASLRARVGAALDRIVTAHPGECVAVFTHGGVIAQILAEVTDAGRPFAFLGASNGSISQIVAIGSRWVLRRFNDTAHMAGDLDRDPDLPGVALPAVTYANGRVMLDADSHVMELPDFLTAHADPGVELPPVSFSSGGKLGQRLATYAAARRHEPTDVDELVGLGDRLLTGAKGYDALGAFDTAERSQALDQLGFERQFVFSTFSTGVVFDVRLAADVTAAAARAHNRAMAALCGDDPRLLGVGATALDDVDAAIAEVEHILSLGLGAVWIPHRAPGRRSPGHDDLDGFWATVAAAGLPVLLHVGGHPLQLDKAFMDTGRPVPTDWLGGGENVRGKDMIGLHHAAETFVGTLVLDGVMERHRGLRLGVIELGAGWVPAMLRRLDHIADIWKRSEPDLAALTRRPSEQLIAQAAFTPYPFEDVGAMIRESHPDLYLFSSDYPHIEGGRDPLGRFTASLDGADDSINDRFYADNMRRLLQT